MAIQYLNLVRSSLETEDTPVRPALITSTGRTPEPICAGRFRCVLLPYPPILFCKNLIQAYEHVAKPRAATVNWLNRG